MATEIEQSQQHKNDSRRNTSMCADESEHLLSEEFLADYLNFCDEYDEILHDFFGAPKYERLTSDFLAKHKSFLTKISLPAHVQYDPRNPSHNDSIFLEEDTNLICRAHGRDENAIASKSDGRKYATNLVATRKPKVVLSDLYRRASQSIYMRVILNITRHKRDEDPRVPLQLARVAIRYDETNFYAWYWYAVTVGKYLEHLTGASERTSHGELFRMANERCTRMNPGESLPHHLLGRYYYHVAKLSWFERSFVRRVLGVKLEGTLKDAERQFLHAHSLEPNWGPTGLWMARVLIAQRRPEEEIHKWIEFGLACKCTDPGSEAERAELVELSNVRMAHR